MGLRAKSVWERRSGRMRVVQEKRRPGGDLRLELEGRDVRA